MTIYTFRVKAHLCFDVEAKSEAEAIRMAEEASGHMAGGFSVIPEAHVGAEALYVLPEGVPQMADAYTPK